MVGPSENGWRLKIQDSRKVHSGFDKSFAALVKRLMAKFGVEVRIGD